MDTNYNTLTVSPSVDAVQEFRIIADGYSAKYGIVPGAQVDIVTRSGTNNLHGSAYEYLRNSALEPRIILTALTSQFPPTSKTSSASRWAVRSKKDKAFFFLSYEGLRIRQSLTQETTVPT